MTVAIRHIISAALPVVLVGEDTATNSEGDAVCYICLGKAIITRTAKGLSAVCDNGCSSKEILEALEMAGNNDAPEDRSEASLRGEETYVVGGHGQNNTRGGGDASGEISANHPTGAAARTDGGSQHRALMDTADRCMDESRKVLGVRETQKLIDGVQNGKALRDSEITLTQASDMLRYVDAEDRETWVQVGMALKSYFGDAAQETYRQFSQRSDKYKERDFNTVWRSFKRGGVGIGTLVHLAKAGGYLNGNGTNGKSQTRREEEKKVRVSLRTLRYEVRDLDGNLKATHLRHEYDDGTKSMPWEPTGIKTTELPLYGSEQLNDIPDGSVVVVCEGEKATEAVWRLNHHAVGSVCGADSCPSDGVLESLKRFEVYLWPDNDEKGRKHMRRIADRLLALGVTSLRMIDWPLAQESDDAAEFSGDIEALLLEATLIGLPDPYEGRHAVDAFEAYTLSRAELREYAVEGLIKIGCTALLAALIGSGKTTLATNFARGWGLGEDVLGRRCRQSRTLAIVSPKEYEAWIETVGFWGLQGLIFIVPSHKAHFGSPQHTADWFVQEMERNHCQTFVLDTLFDFFGMPPNNSGDQNRIVMTEQTPLLDAVREHGYAGLVTGHSPKSEAKAIDPRDPEESFAGHTAWAAQHRMRITIRRKSQGINAIVSGRGGYGDNGILEEHLLLFDEETRLDTLGGLFSQHLGEAALPSVLETLKALDKPVALSSLVKEMGRGEKWIRPGLKEGRKRGVILMEGKGKSTRYRATDPSFSDEDSEGDSELWK